MKYAKDNGIETYERRFMDNVASAKQLAEEFDFKLPTPIDVSVRGMDEELRAAPNWHPMARASISKF